MKFLKRMKKDKNFRIKAILVGVLLVLFFVSFSNEKKEFTAQAICNTANEATDCTIDQAFPEIDSLYLGGQCLDRKLTGGVTDTASTSCLIKDCTIGAYVREYNYDEYACFGCVPDGLRAKTSSDCCSLNAFFDNIEDANGYNYVCKEVSSGESQCNSAEAEIASILQSIGIGVQCKTAYYLTLFIAAFLALIIFAAI